MTPVAALWWIALAAALGALVLAALQAVRATREVVRIKRRVDGFAALPVLVSLEKAGADAERIGASIEALERLVARARAAVEVIRRGPIPPDVVNAAVRIAVEVQNLREFAP
jgi:hypothetical protein